MFCASPQQKKWLADYSVCDLKVDILCQALLYACSPEKQDLRVTVSANSSFCLSNEW